MQRPTATMSRRLFEGFWLDGGYNIGRGNVFLGISVDY
jgi:hypothetical protein